MERNGKICERCEHRNLGICWEKSDCDDCNKANECMSLKAIEICLCCPFKFEHEVLNEKKDKGL